MNTSAETITLPNGKMHVFGRVDGKIVYTSKPYKNPTSAAKTKERWKKRIEKQIRSGRRFT